MTGTWSQTVLRRLLAVALMLPLAVFSPLGAGACAEDRSPVIGVPSTDADMNAAIATARASLGTFWASHDDPKPGERNHALKVRFSTSETNGEHIWVSDVKKRPDGTFTGRLANRPRDIPGKNEGDPVEFKAADISDWMFLRTGKIVGGETLRAMFKSMSKADADALRAQMETP